MLMLRYLPSRRMAENARFFFSISRKSLQKRAVRFLHSARDMETPPYEIQERTFQFACRIVRFCRQLSDAHPVTRKLAFELLKSGTSVGANTEEADAGQTKPDFRTKIAVARKEAKESVYWLRLIAATDARWSQHTPSLLEEANQLASILTAIKKKADENDDR